MSRWKVDKDEFVEAVQNNEYAEYDLNDDIVLIVDTDSRPFIVAPNRMEKQEIDDMLMEEGWFTFEGLIETTQNGIWHTIMFQVDL